MYSCIPSIFRMLKRPSAAANDADSADSQIEFYRCFEKAQPVDEEGLLQAFHPKTRPLSGNFLRPRRYPSSFIRVIYSVIVVIEGQG
jgi:hypothetical protein